MNGRKNFLEARLSIAQADWQKAHDRWVEVHKQKTKESGLRSLRIMAASSRMAFLNGQRKLLKELIALEEADSSELKGE